MTSEPKVRPVIVFPDCQGVARFDTEEQARYVAKGHTAEFDTVFVAVEHDGHYHVIDTGWGEDD